MIGIMIVRIILKMTIMSLVFSDQIYLNKWIKNYGNHIHVFHNNGINISPRVTLKFNLRYKNNQYYIGDEKLRLFTLLD